MGTQRVSLTQLLSAAAWGLAGANRRLERDGAPALLQEMRLALRVAAPLRLQGLELFLTPEPEPPLQQRALPSVRRLRPGATLELRAIAAPSLEPSGPGRGA